MTWDGRQFSPGGSVAVSLPGQQGSSGASKAVTVQDLINLGLIDPGVVSASGTLFSGATTRFAASVATALADSAASIELNSATLFKKMNGAAGVVIGSGGIAGYDSTGTATFTIDPATGNVTLSGTITATDGAIGGFTLGATTLTATSGGNTTIVSSGATAFSAGPTATPTFKVTQAGVVTATGGTYSGITVNGESQFNISPVAGSGLSMFLATIGDSGHTAETGACGIFTHYNPTKWALVGDNITNAAGAGRGVYGRSNSATGSGIYGEGNNGSYGVYSAGPLHCTGAAVFDSSLSANITGNASGSSGSCTGISATANALNNSGGSAHTYKFTGSTVAGADAFVATLVPSGAGTSLVWVEMIIDSTSYYVACVTKP